MDIEFVGRLNIHLWNPLKKWNVNQQCLGELLEIASMSIPAQTHLETSKHHHLQRIWTAQSCIER